MFPPARITDAFIPRIHPRHHRYPLKELKHARPS